MKNVIPFLKDLAENNNREWFAANKKRYETAKEEVEQLVSEIITQVGKWDAGVAGLEAKDCMFRIHRDVRFGKDKSPYKTSMGALIGKDGRKSKSAIHYLHIEPGKSFVAGGSYMPEPDKLKAVRQEIDYGFKEFQEIITDDAFVACFGQLEDEWKGKMVPKGYAADNPAIEYLKYKSHVVSKYFTDKEVTSPGFINEIVKTFKIVQPFNAFLNRALEMEKG
jgi:uncharacterized protein (TIGR02453 family)